MQIQKINNYNNITFQKEKPEKRKDKQNNHLSCDIKEFEKNGKKQICFICNKDELVAFLNYIISKIPVFNKNKYKTIDIKMDANLDKKEQIIDENNENEPTPAKTPTIKEPIFPTPKFSSNPTIEQRDEYVSELLKYINSTPDTKLQLKGLKEIEKYGINRDDICHIGTLTSDNDESIIREALKIYQKHGTNDDAFVIIGPIRRSEIDIKEEETFIEVLKTIQKLAHLENETPKDREIILRPVRRLLDNENENIRKMAQETLDKITPDS